MTETIDDESEHGAGDGNRCGLDPADGLSDRWRKEVWARGSYDAVAPTYYPMAGRLVDAVEVSSSEAVLDVGCGTGAVAIAAARRDADVTGIDIQPAMLERARDHADLAGVDIELQEGDAVDLPVPADAFDATVSNLGHMYGDPPDAAADELIRVTRPGGRIGFTAWTPSSVYPAMAGVLMSMTSPDALPDFAEPPFLWGDADTVRGRLGGRVTGTVFDTETVAARALSPAHFVERTADSSGLFLEIIEAVPPEDRPALRDRLVETVEPYFDERSNAVELEYMRTTATVVPR